MAKIRVHDLAREVGRSNRDVIDYLTQKGYEMVTAVSVVPDSEIADIRAKFGGASPKASGQTAGRPASERGTEDQTSDAHDRKAQTDESGKTKKKGFVRVFRSENATRQLQHRPKKPAQTDRPHAERPAAQQAAPGAESAPAAAKNAPETAAKAAAPQTSAPVKAEQRPAQPKAEPAKTGTDRPAAAPGSAAPKAEGGKAAPKSTEAAKPAETSGTAAKPAEDTGFRNGRIIRNVGPLNRMPSTSSRSGSRSGSQGRNGRPGQGGGFRDRTGGPGSRNGQGPRSGGQGGPGMRSRNGQGRNAFSTDRNGRPGQGRPGFGQNRPGAGRGAAPAGRDGDGALAHKTTRDFRKDGKERERTREERRENGREGGNRPNQQRRQFNRIPKALQHRQPQHEEKKEEQVTSIKVADKITIRELAEKMKLAPSVLIKELFMKGEMVTVNHELPYEKAEEIAMEHNILCEKEEQEDVIGELLAEDAEDEKDLVPRPPVVCVMGHVDHGKTSLLDAIRNTHVTDREAGGITQHIGAYMVSVNGQKITFLDTPGHEAFTAMRMRGANATDIAVLVVAADDGVMPQTAEAINHAKAAKVEIIVAVNKIDKPGANIDRVKQELSEYGLVAEDWGGQTVFCPVSAKTHEGIDNLLEMILLSAEMLELKANPNRKARGIVLEAKLDKGRGPVASILIQKGTLHQGDFIACGAAYGKVRAMTDERGRRLHKATPSMPVEVIGLSSVPEAGEVLVSLDSDKEAKDFAAVFVNEGKKTLIEETRTQMTLDDLYNQIKEGNLKELPIVVKADVQGSVEAVSQSLLKLSNDEVVVKVIHSGVGAINESDVSLAAASNAIIIGFNVRPDNTAKVMADTQKVDIHLYNVIYEAIEDVERALNGMRAAVYEEKVQGHAEIRQMFKASGVGNIAGAYIRDGIFQRSSKVRVFRGEEKIYEGQLASLKRFKDDVKEVKEGFECGFVFDGWGDFQVDDTVEAYTMVEVPRT